MAIKATCIDEAQMLHLRIGLNRTNLEALLRGETVTLPADANPLAEESDIAVVFAETDEELVQNCLDAPAEMAPTRVQ
jgi:hypothetical protein